MVPTEPVLVIGAGVTGLSTGVLLAESGVPVRLRTDARPADTTSAVAGAMWGPARLRPSDRVLEWATRSYYRFVALAQDETTGVHLASGRMVARFELGDELPPEMRLVPDLRRCTAAELPHGFVDGYRATVPLIDMPRYLDHLTDRFRAAGGELLLSPVSSLAEAVEEAHTIVDCTGVGARELVGDPGVHPIRGHTVVVRNPGIDEYFIELSAATEFISYMPHEDRVVLGSTALEHDWSRSADPETTARILRRCRAVEPRLAEAEVLAEPVGLRPGRNLLRLDVERFGGAKIVHNYGHGGSGVALSWGCANEAAALARE